MIKKSANMILIMVLFCTFFSSFSQDIEEDIDGLTLLEDSDDNRIKFESHYFEALKYKAIGNYSRAITELENCQQLSPNNASVLFELSKNFFFLEKFEEANLYISQALELHPDNYWFLEQAKNTYLNQYNYPKAIEIQKKLVAKNHRVSDELVLIYIQANEREKAQQLIDKLESQGIRSSKLVRYKKTIANYKRIKTPIQKNIVTSNNSLEELKTTFESNKQFDILKEILKQELANENFDNLFIFSQKGLDLFPAQPLVYLMNGKAWIQQEKYNNAIDVLNNGIDFVVDDTALEIDFFTQLEKSYKATNQLKKAEESHKKILKLQN